MDTKSIGCVILAGGKSSRMGEDKALLRLNGKTYIECIASQLQGFPERLFSGGSLKNAESVGFKLVPDETPNTGPMGGIYSALAAAKSDALFVIACDMPFFKAELAYALIPQIRAEDDAIIYEDIEKRAHPLCGIYKKSCLPVMLEYIRAGNLKMTGLSDNLRIRRVRLPEGESEITLKNINSKEDIPE